MYQEANNEYEQYFDEQEKEQDAAEAWDYHVL